MRRWTSSRRAHAHVHKHTRVQFYGFKFPQIYLSFQSSNRDKKRSFSLLLLYIYFSVSVSVKCSTAKFQSIFYIFACDVMEEGSRLYMPRALLYTWKLNGSSTTTWGFQIFSKHAEDFPLQLWLAGYCICALPLIPASYLSIPATSRIFMSGLSVVRLYGYICLFCQSSAMQVSIRAAINMHGKVSRIVW